MKITKTVEKYLNKAKEKLKNAEEFINREKYNDIPYFIYYSFFYLMHALLLTKENEIKNYPSSHGGLKKLFSYLFPEFRDFISAIERTYHYRHSCDYKLVDLSKEEKRNSRTLQ